MVCLSFPLSEDRRPTRSFTNIFYFFCTDAHPCILDKRDIAAGEAIRSEGGEDENEEELWKNNGHTFHLIPFFLSAFAWPEPTSSSSFHASELPFSFNPK